MTYLSVRLMSQAHALTDRLELDHLGNTHADQAAVIDVANMSVFRGATHPSQLRQRPILTAFRFASRAKP